MQSEAPWGQLALRVHMHDPPTLDNYGLAKSNLFLYSTLKKWLEAPIPDSPVLYLWGAPGVGKTHLACAAAAAFSGGSQYIGLSPSLLQTLTPDDLSQALHNMPASGLLCLDGIDNIETCRNWEETLFHAYNRCFASGPGYQKGMRWLITAHKSPAHCTGMLPDLRSRLSQATIFQIHALSDGEKKTVLIERARKRGIVLPEKVAQYLITHFARDMGYLCDMLVHLDSASLHRQRNWTIPFVKSVLADSRIMEQE